MDNGINRVEKIEDLDNYKNNFNRSYLKYDKGLKAQKSPLITSGKSLVSNGNVNTSKINNNFSGNNGANFPIIENGTGGFDNENRPVNIIRKKPADSENNITILISDLVNDMSKEENKELNEIKIDTYNPNIEKIENNNSNIESDFKLNGDNFKKFLDHFEKKATNNLIISSSKNVVPDKYRKKMTMEEKVSRKNEIGLCQGNSNGSNLNNLNSNSNSNMNSSCTRPKSVKTRIEIAKNGEIIQENIIYDDSQKKEELDKELSEITNVTQSLFNKKIEDYKILKELGKGSYAVVKKAIHKPSKKTVAIKIYEKFRLMDSQRKDALKREISVMKKLNNINIITLYETIDTPKQVKIKL